MSLNQNAASAVVTIPAMPAKEGSGKEWRIRLYVMENDPDLLLARFKRDFPEVVRWR